MRGELDGTFSATGMHQRRGDKDVGGPKALILWQSGFVLENVGSSPADHGLAVAKRDHHVRTSFVPVEEFVEIIHQTTVCQ